MSDDAWQPDAEEGSHQHPVNNSVRGSKGNRNAQNQRYYKRNKAKRRVYMQRYMAAKRTSTLLTMEAA